MAHRPPSLPDGDDLLWDILLRLPPLPSSLPRASLVCKRWRRLVTDPAFLRCFLAHHRHRPPLLGFFQPSTGSFSPALDPPDRIPAARFSLPLQADAGHACTLLGCRHGLALLLDYSRHEAVLWNPVTGGQHRMPVPPISRTPPLGRSTGRCCSPPATAMAPSNWSSCTGTVGTGPGFVELCESKADSGRDVTWMLQETVELDKLLPPDSFRETFYPAIPGYDEDDNAILVCSRKFLKALLLPVNLVIPTRVSLQQVEVSAESTNRGFYKPAGAEGSVPIEQCPDKCDYRCSATSHRKPCFFFCIYCCQKCLCVPSGRYGNKEECPCYDNMKNKEGGPKCP
ncbi:hypothetical protein C2845_PM01G48000 [Panicum miliaceum]|uniref:F-box domain-containing protein n=1 Tax=Panicum miliaceum TaxID=4540 RepID=A0A3L6TWI0_PANMI|nr:hypothetical protein C2845_PM01G48000 [Panicum miliaceum]